MPATLRRLTLRASWPELARGERGAFGQRLQLGPGDLRMDAAAQPAVSPLPPMMIFNIRRAAEKKKELRPIPFKFLYNLRGTSSPRRD